MSKGLEMIIGIVDYDAGNLTSVETALKHIGAEYIVGKFPEELKDVDKLIFPGVGEASSAMKTLSERGLDEYIGNFAKSGKPLLAICIGSQILLDRSEEGDAKCLGIIPGTVKLFPETIQQKIPHMGWNSVKVEKEHPLFSGVPDDSSFYFVHSYYTNPDSSANILCTTEYGMKFTSAMVKDNITATQFHPEKSGPYGLKILENFMNYKG